MFGVKTGISALVPFKQFWGRDVSPNVSSVLGRGCSNTNVFEEEQCQVYVSPQYHNITITSGNSTARHRESLLKRIIS